MNNRFNLVEEPWIPLADHDRVSLRQIFSPPGYRSLGGNAVQKISLLKLLLAIAQSAETPRDETELRLLGVQGLRDHCLLYLDRWHDRFYLYGERPFLQMPAISSARVQSFGAVLPDVSTGNTTVLSQIQVQQTLDDAEKALLLVMQMGFALSGKKADNKVVLSPRYAGKRNEKGKPSTAKPGPSVAHMGLLHNFLLGQEISQTLWLNVLTREQIAQMGIFSEGLGIAPWEQMPEGEACGQARRLQHSLLGRLVPVCRFCLLNEDGLHYSEGIAHPDYRAGMVDPSVAIDQSLNKPKVLWADPDRRPWRELTSLLSFFEQEGGQGFQSWQLRFGLGRARDEMAEFAIWSGGLKVSSNAGEQYVSGRDDFVESQVWLQSSMLGTMWFTQLKFEMEALDALAKGLYGRVTSFHKEQKVNEPRLAARATHLFWQLCERDFQQLVDCCEQNESAKIQRHNLRIRFAVNILGAYDQFCPRETARQIDAWAKFRPNNSKYLKQEE